MILTHITICLVVASVSLAYNPEKKCNDCQFVLSCPAAVKLLEKYDDHSKDQLRKAFCGFESDSPKVCCSEFEVLQTDVNVEQHPNLRLLPEKCGVILDIKIISVGGSAAMLYEFPWMALISYNTGTGLDFQCGGTLINERYVLTAAHCIVNKNIAGVRVGEYDISSREDCEGVPPERVCESNIQDRLVEKAISHPNYQGKSSGLKNDIGLLRLNPPIDFSFENADAVCLPVTSALRNIDISGKNAIVTGWGYTENHAPSNILLRVDVPVYSKEACSKVYNKFTKVGEEDKTLNKLCAGKKGKDSCGGDSGGPLMTGGLYNNVSRYIQYGVVSYGPADCGSGSPGVYTDVRKYMKWILNNIQP